jgi:CelD/BcsL family acetyltransferase involved in cellulose biosynthesis
VERARSRGLASGEQLRLEPIERLEDIREDWDRLAAETGHPFATWEWNAEWWGRFGKGRELYSFAALDGEGVVRAILPMYMAATKPLRVARFLGYVDLHSPVCAPSDRPLAARALRQLTRSPYRCRLVYLERLPGDQGWGDLLGGRTLHTGHDPVLQIGGRSWEEVLAQRSRNLRQQLRRRERRLLEEHDMTYRLARDPERLPADMDALFRLHAARWGDEATGVFEGDRGAFHRRFAAAALRRGWLRLWLAEIGGKPVAAWYGWRFSGSEWYFQAGRDPAFDQLSIGLVLFAHTIREACRDGMGSYRLLAGLESYKLRFADSDLGTETRLIGPAPLPALGQIAMRATRLLPVALRRRAAQ